MKELSILCNLYVKSDNVNENSQEEYAGDILELIMNYMADQKISFDYQVYDTEVRDE